ncbi:MULTISPECIES: Qat anti-phage system QueC-like protein QatC [Aequorivita]|uniref:7-cyano-7-deazaguanine synthase n=1 Tax=Aequorivita iocasae TaxID=2803865 RepID=A0ABX7DY70_9FLAO|nr:MULTISPECIES: Qat anti-phage system QueC-like protein QatC [Aequorivita]QQX78114.1 7-cyano-7-deazaguanine synthase [Aequorivita iocasae]UCA57625.1 7-cyano-7-deazaguanine synthase [Aequorivita sp. F7]
MNIIVCKLNKEDTFKLDTASQVLDFTNKKEYHHTFFKSLRRLYKMPTPFQEEALDLLYISIVVYFADRKVLRENTYDGWTRDFKLYIPVLNLDKWTTNKEHLEQLVSFLSGDNWSFEFRKRELNKVEKNVKNKIGSWYLGNKFTPDEFCMLSGGLDSFIGAIDLLSVKKNIAFVGLYGGGKGVKPYQDKIDEILQKEFSIDKDYFFNFNATPINGSEITTRTRSFLFFTHAIILASCLNKKTNLYIPENGLISLNIPLTNTRLGSSSTRTTHPYYIKMLQSLLDNMNIKVQLKNPYQFKTKGEMILNCKNPQLIKKEYSQTMSCSHPDQVRYDKSTKPLHCGKCLPCSIRRASIIRAYNKDVGEYSDPNFEKPKANKELLSFKLGLLDFEKNKNNPLIIQVAGPIEKDFENYDQVYKRGMDELKVLIDTIDG